MLTLVGLGPGDADALPARTFSLLADDSAPLLLRTARHPCIESGPIADALKTRTRPAVALDEEYEAGESFSDTYAAIVARVLRTHEAEGNVVYAVPGHPLVGESTVALILGEAKQRGISVKVVGAPSFVEACLTALGESITGDLHIIDALSLQPDAPAISPALRGRGDAPLLLYQVHSRAAASQAKLALMRAGYPDDFPVTIVQAAGVPGLENVQPCLLHALDRTGTHDHLTSVFVPPLPSELRSPAFPELVEVMARLRNRDNGCPWDLKQTHQTLRPYVLEEAYEVAEAIDNGDPDKLCEELGDLLLQVVFHAQLAAEEGVFTVEDVSAAIVQKLIRRHPHIFGNVKADTPEEVLTNWQALKAAEKGHQERKSVLDGIPKSLPALMAAMETSVKAVKAGFEWDNTADVLCKAEEEFAELRAEVEAQNPSKSRIESELGDVLFTLVNVARRAEIDAETALRRQMERFGRRFRHIEARAEASGQALETLGLAQMETYWQEAKEQEKKESEE